MQLSLQHLVQQVDIGCEASSSFVGFGSLSGAGLSVAGSKCLAQGRCRVAAELYSKAFGSVGTVRSGH